MNKWSLKFPDEVLESNYRLKTQTTISYPVFSVLILTGMVDMAYGIVINIINEQQTRLITSAFLLLLSTIVTLIIRKHHKYVNFGLLFLIMVYIVMSTILLPQNSKPNIMTQAYCLMICNCIILYIQEFRFGIFQILCLLIMVLLIQFLVIGVASTSLIIAFIWLSLIQMFCIFKLQQHTREFFLLSQKDSNFQTILSQIATRPFVIFDFDQEKFRFKQLYSHQLSLSDILNSQLNKKLFGDFIYDRQKQNSLALDEVLKKDFLIKYQDKITLVNYSEFYLSQKTFMIILNVKENHDIQKIAQFQISTFIKENIKALVHVLQAKSRNGKQILAKICLNNLIAQKTLTYIAKPHFSLVDIVFTLRNYLKLLELACTDIKCALETTEYRHIITVEPLFCLIIIEILFQFKDCKTLDCIIESGQGSVLIKFHSDQFNIHKPVSHIKEGLQFILTSFNQVAQGFEMCVDIE